MMSEVREANFAAKNFHPGYIVLKNGTKKEGKIALRFTIGGNQRYFAKQILLEKEGGEYKTLTSKNEIQTVVQQINGENNVYEHYKDGFTKHIKAGEIVLMRNPYSTSTNKFLTSVANSVKEELAKEAAKATLKDLVKRKNGNIEEVKENYDTVNSIDATIGRKEYLVRFKSTNEITIVKKDNVKKWADTLFENCNAYKKLSKKEQKKIRKWDSVVSAVVFYNASCQ